MNWPQGSVLDSCCFPIDESADYSWAAHTLAFAGYEQDFPTLTRAAHRTIPASTVEIEWLDTNGLQRNFTQIFRTPWSGPAADDRVEEFLHNHLRDIEWALVHGTPQLIKNGRGGPLHFTGGTTHFLGREEVGPDDLIILRPLAGRELLHRSWLNPGGSRTSEWLSELTLQVSPPGR